MKTVELFAGIGGFRVAADRLKLQTIWANDACAKACKVYRARFGDASICEGDITTMLDYVPPHDLLTAGFPCQPFSSAGKKQGISDPRGTLFNVVVELLRRHQPAMFVLENVKRLLTMQQGIHFATILASLAELNYRIEWRLLNAAHFGLPQNRQRVFVVGVRKSKRQTAVVIRLATNIDLSTQSVPLLQFPNQWRDIASHGQRFPNWGLADSGRFCGANLKKFSLAKPMKPLLTVLQSQVSPEFDFTESTVERLKASKNVKRYVDGVQIISNQSGGARMGYTVFGINGLAPTLTSTASRHYERYKVGDRYRRLTNVEYARLQGFPDDHCSAVSVYDQYALYGNAVPPPMVAWILRRVSSEGLPANRLPRQKVQARLFVDA